VKGCNNGPALAMPGMDKGEQIGDGGPIDGIERLVEKNQARILENDAGEQSAL
jgi:hypothetical protein